MIISSAFYGYAIENLSPKKFQIVRLEGPPNALFWLSEQTKVIQISTP